MAGSDSTRKPISADSISHSEDDDLSVVQHTTPSQPFAFSAKQRGLIIIFACLALASSAFPIQAYFPSLVVIEKELNTTATLVDTSIALYRLIEAFTPTLWGALADQWGRRPVYIISMSIATAASAGIAASPTVGAFIGVRMMQAFGVSAIQTVGFGVANDISVPATRAGYLSYFQIAFRTTTVAGPVLGGVIAQHLSWRWCFWIAFIFGVVVLILVSLFLPETLRVLAGGYYNPTPIQWATKQVQPDKNADEQKSRFRRMPDFRDPYSYLLLPDFFLIMLLSGFYVGAQGTFNISMTYLFHDYYNLQEQDIGLCFLPQAIGSVIGAICAGRVLNARFRAVGKRYDDAKSSDEKAAYTNTIPIDLPIYQARLGSVWPNAIAASLLTVLHGWMFEIKTHISVPLIIEFCVSFNIMFITAAAKSLLGDLRPDKGASVSASNCLIWNLFIVAGSMSIYPVTKAIGPGWTYTAIGSMMMLFNLAIIVLTKFGPIWRAKRQEAARTK